MKNRSVEKEIQKELMQKFGENSILQIEKDTFLILCKGEAFKFIKGSIKGFNGQHSKVMELALHHNITAELWIYNFTGKDVSKEINVLYNVI